MDTSNMTNYDSGQGMFLLLILLFVYFIPGIVGFSKGKNSAGAIFLLNLFLGWSFIGWVIALIWAAANDPKGQINTITMEQIRAVEEARKK